MSQVSIIIPVRVELYEVLPGVSVLQRTVQDIYEHATGDFEVIVVFDGPPYQKLPPRDNLICLEREWQGTKPAINAAADIASGKYVLKTDAHCMFAKGFDEELAAHCEENWIVMPRFYVLDAEHWRWQDARYYDYFFLPCPFTDRRGFRFKAGCHWKERTSMRAEVLPLDENMKLHGSAFFMNRDFFCHELGGLSTFGSGTWNGEDIELTMKTWLGPWRGRIMVNKNTWYAHMHRGSQRPREFGFSYQDAERSARWSAHYWMADKWPYRTRSIEWLVDKFWPVPGWPENWKELRQEWLKTIS